MYSELSACVYVQYCIILCRSSYGVGYHCISAGFSFSFASLTLRVRDRRRHC